MLPCKYCRKSYKGFLKKIPIDKYLGSRNDITYWFYLVKDQVNKKLIKQEKKKLKDEVAKLTNPTKAQISALERKHLYTKPSPPFEVVCKEFEEYRAKCGATKKEIESCRAKEIAQVGDVKKKKYKKTPF